MRSIIIFFSIFFFVSSAKADYMNTSIVLNLFSSTKKKDKYSKTISEIDKKLPPKGYYAPFESIEFKVPQQDFSYYLNHYQSQGYNVKNKNGILYFDYKGHSAKRKIIDQQNNIQNMKNFRFILIVMTFIIFLGIPYNFIKIRNKYHQQFRTNEEDIQFQIKELFPTNLLVLLLFSISEHMKNNKK